MQPPAEYDLLVDMHMHVINTTLIYLLMLQRSAVRVAKRKPGQTKAELNQWQRDCTQKNMDTNMNMRTLTVSEVSRGYDSASYQSRRSTGGEHPMRHYFLFLLFTHSVPLPGSSFSSLGGIGIRHEPNIELVPNG